MKAEGFKRAAILASVSLTAGALLFLQLTRSSSLTATESANEGGAPGVRVIGEYPPVELVDQRDDHTRVWEVVREVETTHPDGSKRVDTVKSRIFEKGSGLCYRDDAGNFVPSVPEWRQTPNGFVVDRCAYGLSIGKTIGPGLG